MADSKCKHISLTHFMRRRCVPNVIRDILTRCDVSPYVGCLPPQLVGLVPAENRANVTLLFAKCLSDFWNQNLVKIRNLCGDMTFDMPDVSALFNTPCVLYARGINATGCSPWFGGFGIVCKLSFPAIGAEYALKRFVRGNLGQGHGAQFEISTAFAANHAEPRDNCPVYMASVVPECEYMLSKWGGDTPDDVGRHNEYQIFVTSDEECDSRNWRGGRRIDFGETFQTEYGCMAYRVRKLFRKVLRAAERGDGAELDCMRLAARNVQERKDVEYAIDMARIYSVMHDKDNVYNIIMRNRKTR